MQIDNTLGTALSAALTGSAAQARQAVATASTPTPGTTVQLSPQMKALEEKLSLQSKDNISTFDAQKVQSIRAQIAEGRFQVDAGNVANGLLASVQTLIRNNPQLAG